MLAKKKLTVFQYLYFSLIILASAYLANLEVESIFYMEALIRAISIYRLRWDLNWVGAWYVMHS
jgi:hypothetical protein